jgi:hypothetical protein
VVAFCCHAAELCPLPMDQPPIVGPTLSTLPIGYRNPMAQPKLNQHIAQASQAAAARNRAI